MSSLKICLSSSCFGFRLEPTFEMAQKMGLDGVEILPFKWQTSALIQKMVNYYNVPVLGIHAPWWIDKTRKFWMYKGGLTGNRFREFIETLSWKMLLGSWEDSKSVDIYKQLRCEYIILHADLLWEIKNILKTDIPAGTVVENVDNPHWKFTNNFANTLAIALPYALPLCLDIEHCGSKNENIIEIFNRYRQFIKVVQFSDFTPDSYKGNLVPGQGILPLKEFIQVIRELKWDGILTIELMPAFGKIPFLTINHDKCFDNVIRTLDFIKSI